MTVLIVFIWTDFLLPVRGVCWTRLRVGEDVLSERSRRSRSQLCVVGRWLCDLSGLCGLLGRLGGVNLPVHGGSSGGWSTTTIQINRQTFQLDTFLWWLKKDAGALRMSPPCPLSIMGVSVREEQLLRATLQLVAQPTRVIPANMPSTLPLSSPKPPAPPSPGSNTISPAG